MRDLAAMIMAQVELQHAFGRIDPISGLPNRNHFLDDLVDLARDRGGERRIAVVVALARPEEINSIARVMKAARVDDMLREGARALRAQLGPDRNVHQVGARRRRLGEQPSEKLVHLRRRFCERVACPVVHAGLYVATMPPSKFGQASRDRCLVRRHAGVHHLGSMI